MTRARPEAGINQKCADPSEPRWPVWVALVPLLYLAIQKYWRNPAQTTESPKPLEPSESISAQECERKDNAIAEASAATDASIVASTKSLMGVALFATCIALLPDIYIIKSSNTISVPLAGPATFTTFCVIASTFLLINRVQLELLHYHWSTIPTARLVLEPLVFLAMRNRVARKVLAASHLLVCPLVLAALSYRAMAIPKLGAALLIITAASLLIPGWRESPPHFGWRSGALVLLVAALVVTPLVGPLAHLHRAIQANGGNLSRENLEHRDLRGAQLAYADLTRSNMRGADLSNANLFLANLQQVSLIDMDRRGIEQTIPANFSESFLGGANFCQSFLGKSNFTEARAPAATFRGSDLTLTDFSRANLNDADFRNTEFFATNLSDAYIERTQFQNAQFRCIKLEKCAEFYGRRLEDVNSSLCCTSMKGAKGSNTAKFQKACKDDGVTLPEGVNLPRCTSDHVDAQNICDEKWKPQE